MSTLQATLTDLKATIGGEYEVRKVRRGGMDLPEPQHGKQQRVSPETVQTMWREVDDDRAAGGIPEGRDRRSGQDHERSEKEVTAWQ